MQKYPALSSWTDISVRNCSHRLLSNRISEVTYIFKCSSSCKCWFIYSLNRAHWKRKEQNQTQVATLRDLRTPVGLTDPVPREMPDALGGRLTVLLPSCPDTPGPQEPPASVAPWQEQGTGQEHMPYLTASRLSPTCLPILTDSA